MNRDDKRRFKKFAAKNGIDVDNFDLSIVTAHFKTRFIQVITEQSSYLIDLEQKRALRIPGDDASHTYTDGDWYQYENIYSCAVTFPLRMDWYDGDRLLLRTTTPITVINELELSEAAAIAGSL